MQTVSSTTPVWAINPTAVRGLAVRELFGRYTYAIPEPSKDPAGIAKVLIIYGDNGSGKTTLLQLLYHLLSPEPRRGHRSFLARTRFRSLTTWLADGTWVRAERLNDELEGGYRFSICARGSDEVSADLVADAEGSINEQEPEVERAYKQVLEQLEKLNIALFFLADDRTLTGSLVRQEADRGNDASYLLSAPESLSRELLSRLAGRGRGSGEGFDLDAAMERAVDWIRRQVFAASSRGMANINTIYTDIVKRIAASPAADGDANAQEIRQLLDTLCSVSDRSDDFARYGLAPTAATRDLISSLSDAPAERRQIIYTVLKPYVDGFVARLDALQDIHDVIGRFTRTISGLYADKYVDFDVVHGLRVFAETGELLEPQKLSRGEKQLMLLMCYTLCAREQPSIFIVDEPEISLNVKWQRQLVQVLLDCVAGSQVQFVLATHSIELLARHGDHVVKLDPHAGREATDARGRAEDD